MARLERLMDIGPAVLLREAWEIGAPPMAWITSRSYLGKSFARLETSNGPLYLRRYPVGTSPQWLRAVHAAMDGLTRRGFDVIPPFLPTPTGETLIRHGGLHYDLSPWAPGSRVATNALGFDRLGNLGAAVARLHLAGANASGPTVRLDWLAPRHLAVQKLAWDSVPRGKDSWLSVDQVRAFFAPLAANATVQQDASAREVVATAALALDWIDRVGASPADDEAPILTHGDLWSDHVRFEGSRVTAIVDLDTLGLRPPTGDIAALCADFAEWDLARCAAVLDGYRRHRPVATSAIEALPRLSAQRTLGVLRERLRAWLGETPDNAPGASLAGPVPYWCAQLRALTALDLPAFARI